MSAEREDATQPRPAVPMSQFALMALQGQLQRFAESVAWEPDDLGKVEAVRFMVQQEWLSGEEAAGDAG